MGEKWNILKGHDMGGKVGKEQMKGKGAEEGKMWGIIYSWILHL